MKNPEYNIKLYGSDRLRIIQLIKLETVSTWFKPSLVTLRYDDF